MKRVFQYIGIAFLFSWTAWGLQYLGQENILPEWFQIFGMFGLFGPLVSFLVMIKLDKKSYRDVLKKMFQKAPTWTYIFSFISPLVLSFIAYLSYRYFITGDPEAIGVTWISIIPVALMILFVGGPIEEFGWRGYLLPLVREKHDFIRTVMFIGLVHGLWHFPLHYLNGTVQEALPVYEFLIITVAITVSYVFIFEYTKSIIPMIALHWFSNLSSAIFPYFYSLEGRYTLLVMYIILDICLIYLIRNKKVDSIPT